MQKKLPPPKIISVMALKKATLFNQKWLSECCGNFFHYGIFYRVGVMHIHTSCFSAKVIKNDDDITSSPSKIMF